MYIHVVSHKTEASSRSKDIMHMTKTGLFFDSEWQPYI